MELVKRWNDLVQKYDIWLLDVGQLDIVDLWMEITVRHDQRESTTVVERFATKKKGRVNRDAKLICDRTIG